MAVESIFYSVSGLSCRGALIWDEGVKAPRPLLLMAPNWRGVIKPAIETGQMLAAEGYVVFVADMFGEGNGPVGTENPMEFLRPFMSDVAGHAPAHRGGARHLDAGGRPARHRRHHPARGHRLLLRRPQRPRSRAHRRRRAGGRLHARHAGDAAAGQARATSRPRCWPCTAPPIRSRPRPSATPSRRRWMRPARAGRCSRSAAWSTPSPIRRRNMPGVAVYNEPATRHGYALAHAFIADAFAGKL